MTHGGVRIQLDEATQGELTIQRGRPIDRARPLLALHRGPAIGEPKPRVAIAAVVDECEVFRVGDESRRQLEGLEVDAMTGRLVVETKPARALHGGAARLDEAAGEMSKGNRRSGAGPFRGLAYVGRQGRVA